MKGVARTASANQPRSAAWGFQRPDQARRASVFAAGMSSYISHVNTAQPMCRGYSNLPRARPLSRLPSAKGGRIRAASPIQRNAWRSAGGRSLRAYGVPTGIRTPVTAVKGRCPRPLDDGDRGFYCKSVGGGNRDRTGDLLHAMQELSQLSYTPKPRRRIIAAYLVH